MPGSHTSRTTTSKTRRLRRSRQASPLSTASTLYPSSRSTPLSELRTPGSSSTIRMEDIQHPSYCSRFRVLASRFVFRFGAALPSINLAGRSSLTGQFDRETGSAWHVVADVDAAAVLGNNPADDGQPQPASPLLRGVIRKEQLVPFRRWNTGSVIGNDDPHQTVPGEIGRAHV